MTGPGPAELLRSVGELASDRELLARFVHARDQGAFAQLVRRHGPVVLGVCRRVAGHSQDAEDAFQAAFLILARKAATVADPDRVGNYLYGVAVRVAQKARRAAARRRAREVQVSTMPDPAVVDPDSPDIAPVLHEELSKLPACYRDAIVLCDLRGLARADAAVALGIPEGTLSSRLANGRKKLADRLARRGVALSAAAIPTALGEGIAAVPESLVGKTCGVVANWSAGVSLPAAVSRLAAGGFDVKKLFAVGLCTAALAAAGAVFAGRPDADPPRPDAAQKQPPKKAEPKAEAKEIKFAAPRLRERADLTISTKSPLRWSADGTQIAVAGTEQVLDNFSRPTDQTRPMVAVITLRGLESRKFEYPPRQTLAGFAPNGSVLIELREHALISGRHQFALWSPTKDAPKAWEPGYTAGLVVEIPAEHSGAYAFTGEGMRHRAVMIGSELEVREIDAAGEVRKKLVATAGSTFGLSPDGKRLAVLTEKSTVTVFDVDRESRRVTELPLPADKDGPPVSKTQLGLVFSPDGKRLIVTRGMGQTFVLNADTGVLLPALEGLDMSEMYPPPHAFTGDGRLIVLTGSRYVTSKQAMGRPPGGGEPLFRTSYNRTGTFVGVWETQTGKALKVWDRTAAVGFSPTYPVLATLEPVGGGTSRLGLWDFKAEE